MTALKRLRNRTNDLLREAQVVPCEGSRERPGFPGRGGGTGDGRRLGLKRSHDFSAGCGRRSLPDGGCRGKDHLHGPRMQMFSGYCVQELEDRGLQNAEKEVSIPGAGRDKQWDVACSGERICMRSGPAWRGRNVRQRSPDRRLVCSDPWNAPAVLDMPSAARGRDAWRYDAGRSPSASLAGESRAVCRGLHHRAPRSRPNGSMPTEAGPSWGYRRRVHRCFRVAATLSETGSAAAAFCRFFAGLSDGKDPRRWQCEVSAPPASGNRLNPCAHGLRQDPRRARGVDVASCAPAERGLAASLGVVSADAGCWWNRPRVKSGRRSSASGCYGTERVPMTARLACT